MDLAESTLDVKDSELIALIEQSKVNLNEQEMRDAEEGYKVIDDLLTTIETETPNGETLTSLDPKLSKSIASSSSSSGHSESNKSKGRRSPGRVD